MGGAAGGLDTCGRARDRIQYASERGRARPSATKRVAGCENLSLVVKTQQFEGPLDLLLQLIEKARVDIRDIFVSEITQQYIEIVQDMQFDDMEEASDFLTMAATLLLIKSRVLLPKPPKPEEDEEEDPEEAFIRRVEAYKRIKDACAALRSREGAEQGTYWKLREEMPVPPPPLDESKMTLENLLAATLAMLARGARPAAAQKPPARQIVRDDFHVHTQAAHIRNVIRRRQRARFVDFFRKGSRMEIAVTFMAMLELWRHNQIVIEQNDIFGDIWVEAAQTTITDRPPEREGEDDDID